MNQMDHFAQTVAQKRKEKNMTQEALAKQLGISPQAVSKWENGLGLPDVTLFPALAEALDLSLAELFGVEEPTVASNTNSNINNEETSRVPKFMAGLPLVGMGSRRACYSSKPLVEQKGEKLFFGDGSEADLESGWSTNCGAGDIRIYKIEEIGHLFCNQQDGEDSKTLIEKEWTNFPKTIQSLYFSVHSFVDIRILKGEGDTCKLRIKGSKRFLAATTVENDKETLTVRVKNQIWNHWGGRDSRREQFGITLWVPFEKGKLLHASLYGAGNLVAESDFAVGELRISGSGDFAVRSFEKSLSASIAGSGDIHGTESLGTTKLRISGSGDMQFDRVHNADIKIAGSGDINLGYLQGKSLAQISGSGDIRIADATGELTMKISGSGDLTCGGALDKLSFTASGSGDLNGKQLTVKDATIHAMGNSDIEIGRITGSSTEKLSKESVLKVGRRG